MNKLIEFYSEGAKDNGMNDINKHNWDGFKAILDPWRNSVYPFEDSYKLLVSSLNSGWQLKEPVILCSSRENPRRWLFQFILKQPLFREVNIITTYSTPEIERLVSNKEWHVDRSSLKISAN